MELPAPDPFSELNDLMFLHYPCRDDDIIENGNTVEHEDNGNKGTV